MPTINLKIDVKHSNHTNLFFQRMNAANNTSNYRNLRLGNFIENGESNEDELIPERLRQYYLDTYLDDPTSPLKVGIIQRGM